MPADQHEALFERLAAADSGVPDADGASNSRLCLVLHKSGTLGGTGHDVLALSWPHPCACSRLNSLRFGCSSRPSWLSSQHTHGNTCSLAANSYFDQENAVRK